MTLARAAASPPAVLTVERARALLAECKDVDDAKEIRDKAEAVRVYLRSVNAATAAQHDAAEIVLRANRRMGELLAKMPKDTGGRPKTGCDVQPVSPPTLADLGIEKTEAHRAQRLAEIPDKLIDSYIADCRAKDKPVTKGGALALVKEPKPAAPPWHPFGAVGGLKELIRKHVEDWPDEGKAIVPTVLRDLADELENA